MRPTEYRADGWPICPVCGQDELGVLEVTLMPRDLGWYLQRPMFCYWCGHETVGAGEALGARVVIVEGT